MVKAHRFSYERFVGTIPEGLVVCHRCDNTICINPEHLFVGTIQDNMDDMKQKGRSNKLFGQNHNQAKQAQNFSRSSHPSDGSHPD